MHHRNDHLSTKPRRFPWLSLFADHCSPSFQVLLLVSLLRFFPLPKPSFRFPSHSNISRIHFIISIRFRSVALIFLFFILVHLGSVRPYDALCSLDFLLLVRGYVRPHGKRRVACLRLAHIRPSNFNAQSRHFYHRLLQPSHPSDLGSAFLRIFLSPPPSFDH